MDQLAENKKAEEYALLKEMEVNYKAQRSSFINEQENCEELFEQDAQNTLKLMNFWQNNCSKVYSDEIVEMTSSEDNKENNNNKNNNDEIDELLMPEMVKYAKDRAAEQDVNAIMKMDAAIVQILFNKKKGYSEEEQYKEYILLSPKANDSVRLKDFHRLRSNEWINSPIVNAYLSLLNARHDDILILDTGFWINLTKDHTGQKSYQYPNVQRWTKRKAKNNWKAIFDYNIVIVPCNINGDHWVAGVIAFDLKSIETFDSIFNESVGSYIIATLKRFVIDDWKHKFKGNNQLFRLNWSDWTTNMNSQYQQQMGSNNCGMFMLETVRLICEKSLVINSFANKDIDNIRNKCAEQICTGYLLD